MPLVVFILLLVLLLMLVGIACACLSDHPMQTVDRTISSIAAMPAVLELWTYALAALLLTAFVVLQPRRVGRRATPADLQRFLF